MAIGIEAKLRRLLLGVALMSAGCSPVYVLRAGIEEAKILSRRRPIPEVMRAAGTDSMTKRKLDLVLQARTFAERQLELNAGESFTTYSWVEHDTLLMVLSAARKDRFEQHSWWFPIVGRVPYKGYFDFEEAYRAAAVLEREGFDTYVRPTSAFSTLGWFNDPLLNTVLRYGDVSIASTVIHELVHNTVYVPSQISFNESFANFVGDRGAADFFCSRNGEHDPRCTTARNLWADNLVFGRYLAQLIASLEALYARPGLDLTERLRVREEIFRSARDRFTSEVEPQLKTNSFRGFNREPLNNATLIATRLYYDRLDLFEAVYQRLGGDLVAATRTIIDLARKNTDDPYAAVVQYLGAK